MFNLFIAAIAGLLACIAYWTDHTMVRSESKPVNTDTWWKLFIGGFAIAYTTILFTSSGETPPTEDVITEIVDTIKTGQPSF